MEAMFRSLFTFIVTFADTFTMGMLALNNLARSGVERTVVVEKKSVTAAALSELANVNQVAERLQEIEDDASNITPESFTKAEVFLTNYQNRRKAELAGVPVMVRRAASKKPGKRGKQPNPK